MKIETTQKKSCKFWQMFPRICQTLPLVILALFIWPQNVTSFSWDATLDRSTGIASSSEVSKLTLENGYHDGPTANDSIQRQKSKVLVSSWTKFLCQGSVTFGILQTKLDPKSGASSLHFRCFPAFPILTFGPIQERGKDAWEIPIWKSWLALSDPTCPRRYGCLRFEVKHLDGRIKRNHHSSIVLESSIVGYRPWLVGNPPVSRARKFLYLNTQSRLHAYVTWRFHKAWRQRLMKTDG